LEKRLLPGGFSDEEKILPLKALTYYLSMLPFPSRTLSPRLEGGDSFLVRRRRLSFLRPRAKPFDDAASCSRSCSLAIPPVLPPKKKDS